MKRWIILLMFVLPFQLFGQWDGVAWDGGRSGVADAATPLVDNLAAYWSGENSLVDSSGHDYDLVDGGAILYSSLGKKGESFRFDQSAGAFGYYPYSANDSIDFEDPFTMTMWVYFYDFADYRALVSSDSTSPSEGMIVYYHTTDDSIKALVDGVGPEYAMAGNGIVDSTWYFLAVSHDGIDFNFYFGDENGLQRKTEEITMPVEAHQLSIGRGNGVIGAQTARYHYGNIDEISIHNAYMDSSLISVIYNNYEGLTYTDFVAYTQ